MKYYPVVKNWRKIKPHLQDKELNKILVRDFNKYTYGMNKETFKQGMLPRDFEGCDWDRERKGRRPEYFNYIRFGACHWTVNFLLRLAKLVEPNKKWIILSSDSHSTVWDGEQMLFDFNFLAFDIPADDCFKASNSRHINGYMRVYHADRDK